MANMKLIEAKTLGSTTASVTFSDIPATYTDLKLVISSRSSDIYNEIHFRFSGDTAGNYSGRSVYGTGTAVTRNSTSSITSLQDLTVQSLSTHTANTFGNVELYIPNYRSGNSKSISADGVQENNSTSAIAHLGAGLWVNSEAITTITAFPSIGNFAAGSTFYLYGISSVTEGSKATGGIVSYDSNYYYHMFPYSGTFTPTTSLTADYLVIAGGGSGAGAGGGGGAGGLRSTVTVSGGSPGTVESALSLTAQAYTVTVGAGGAGNSVSGSNSVFSTITSTGGGAGGDYDTAGANGGSGGGGAWGDFSRTGGSASPSGQGFAGGNNQPSGSPAGGGGGGGGGASVAGGTASAGVGGNGGNGVQITAFANPTQTGVNGYYAGGGGGWGNSTAGKGGLGGGGAGNTGSGSSIGTVGTANTGGGGGSGYGRPGANGGSGLVIIRYAI
jgi:hypothetical protein